MLSEQAWRIKSVERKVKEDEPLRSGIRREPMGEREDKSSPAVLAFGSRLGLSRG